MADEWIAPGGYHLCAHGKCGEPKATAKRLDDETSWKCEGTCEKDGDHDCGCCQVAVPPRGKQVIILAEPGDEWKWSDWHRLGHRVPLPLQGWRLAAEAAV